MLPLDQMHEQLNDWLKKESGTISNLDDPRTVCCKQVLRPEMTRIMQPSWIYESDRPPMPRHVAELYSYPGI